MHPPAPPRPRKRKSNTLLIVLLSIMAALVVVLGVVVIVGITHQDKPANPSGATPGPVTPTADPSEARPGVDVGAGTPNAPCATNRQGWHFVKDGKTYICQGPAPYRWREQP